MRKLSYSNFIHTCCLCQGAFHAQDMPRALKSCVKRQPKGLCKGNVKPTATPTTSLRSPTPLSDKTLNPTPGKKSWIFLDNNSSFKQWTFSKVTCILPSCQHLQGYLTPGTFAVLTLFCAKDHNRPFYSCLPIDPAYE